MNDKYVPEYPFIINNNNLIYSSKYERHPHGGEILVNDISMRIEQAHTLKPVSLLQIATVIQDALNKAFPTDLTVNN
jgi:hypothetical protein